MNGDATLVSGPSAELRYVVHDPSVVLQMQAAVANATGLGGTVAPVVKTTKRELRPARPGSKPAGSAPAWASGNGGEGERGKIANATHAAAIGKWLPACS